MQIKKFDGFEDVQSEKLPKIRGVIKVDGVKLRRISSDHRLTSTLFLRDKKFFAKRWIDAHSVQELATSKMYSDLGVVLLFLDSLHGFTSPHYLRWTGYPLR